MQKSGSEWDCFRAVCRDVYGFEPEKDGAITAAEKLSGGKPSWELVWERYKEAPKSYPAVKDLLNSKGQMSLFEKRSEYKPRSNQNEEERLGKELINLSSLSPKEAIDKIHVLVTEHAERSKWVWATLGESPLAMAIGHLRDLAEVVQAPGNPSTWEGLAEYYSTIGWKADRSVLRALDAARPTGATKAVTAAITAVYLPWLEKFSLLMQALAATYPVTGPQKSAAATGIAILLASSTALIERSLEGGLEDNRCVLRGRKRRPAQSTQRVI